MSNLGNFKDFFNAEVHDFYKNHSDEKIKNLTQKEVGEWGDELQNRAFAKLKMDVSIQDWEDHEESCEIRTDFENSLLLKIEELKTIDV